MGGPEGWQGPDERELEDDDVFDPSIFLNKEYIAQGFSLPTGLTLDLLTLPSASTDFDLTGQILWPAARHMADFLSNHPDLVSGRNVLELGSGLGLAGLAAAQFCRQLTVTDGSDIILEVLQQNVELNLPRLQQLNRDVQIQCQRLQWGDILQAEALLHSLPQAPDLIMGADVCYQEESIGPLFSTAAFVMQSARDGSQGKGGPRFLLAYCERNRRTTKTLEKAAKDHRLRMEVLPGAEAQVDANTLAACIYSLVLEDAPF